MYSPRAIYESVRRHQRALLTLRRAWDNWLSSDEPRELTRSGNVRRPTRQDIVNKVGTAMSDVKSFTMIASFPTCGVGVGQMPTNVVTLNNKLRDILFAQLEEVHKE